MGLGAGALLLMCAGFGLQQTLGPGQGAAGGSSMVAARPGVIDPAPTSSARSGGDGDGAGRTASPDRPSASAAGSPTATRLAGARGPSGTGATASMSAASSLAAGSGVAAAVGDPFASANLYVDPDSDAARAVNTLRATDPAGAQTLSRIADHGHADWFGDPNPTTVRTQVAQRVRVARAAGALPLLVAYAIAQRDCGGGQSVGGVADQAAYPAWIDAFAAGLGQGAAAVIVEPDALAQMDCLSPAATTARYAMLNYAVDKLAGTGADVYLDAGHADWQPAAVMASRLRLAGVERARGFALNVSNFDDTASEIVYGDAVVAAVGGGAHYVVDTSRNGRGPAADNTWCNPPGRGLGVAPTAATGNPRVDAFLWVKVPGESDGACNGGPAAGQWWLEYAQGLASRAA
ncbi:glycoside hydrolase family 6 protein [Frankia sp. AiPa1]|uniref:glycoside hydrolase family 6 protein n=1 Tax=Frankia sp. AiPa1 TaxID=573492 RepID=UPI00202AD2EC|nr:glycoside hydrolase family 6 protein [Frankia sp. AiPa1]MCL9760636.1 glycoside hydrolase family 6 protein [Frankia sp. AiPa1]